MNILSKINAFALLSFSCFYLLSSSWSQAQQVRSPAREVLAVTSAYKGNFGIAWKHVESGDSGVVNNLMRFPMQSVYKFPLALAVLDLVDNGKLKLKQKITITPDDYSPNTWSPIMKKYPNANVQLTLQEILEYMVSHSDNVACDILFRLVGGPLEAEKFIHSTGVRDIAIRFTEEEMHTTWDTQFDNWCLPGAMSLLLEKFHSGEILSRSSRALVSKMMIQTTTGPKRIKGLLPAGTVVAHKTGSGSKGSDGNISALNDAGIITLPDKTHLIIVAFVAHSPEKFEDLEHAIARISKALYDHYAERRL